MILETAPAIFSSSWLSKDSKFDDALRFILPIRWREAKQSQIAELLPSLDVGETVL